MRNPGRMFYVTQNEHTWHIVALKSAEALEKWRQVAGYYDGDSLTPISVSGNPDSIYFYTDKKVKVKVY